MFSAIINIIKILKFSSSSYPIQSVYFFDLPIFIHSSIIITKKKRKFTTSSPIFPLKENPINDVKMKINRKTRYDRKTIFFFFDTKLRNFISKSLKPNILAISLEETSVRICNTQQIRKDILFIFLFSRFNFSL